MQQLMSVRVEHLPSPTTEIVEWLWEAYSKQMVIEWNGHSFLVTRIDTNPEQMIVELTPLLSLKADTVEMRG